MQPVFEAIAERSNRLVNGLSTAVYRLFDDTAHLMAFTPVSPEADAALQALFPAPVLQIPWGEAIGKGETYFLVDAKSNSQRDPPCWSWRGCAAGAACWPFHYA